VLTSFKEALDGISPAVLRGVLVPILLVMGFVMWDQGKRITSLEKDRVRVEEQRKMESAAIADLIVDVRATRLLMIEEARRRAEWAETHPLAR